MNSPGCIVPVVIIQVLAIPVWVSPVYLSPVCIIPGGVIPVLPIKMSDASVDHSDHTHTGRYCSNVGHNRIMCLHERLETDSMRMV